MDTAVLHEETLHAELMSSSVNVQVQVFSTYLTVLDFSLHGSAYTFTLDKWRSRKFAKFFELFHSHEGRDAVKFGTVTVDDDGQCTISANVQQKVAAVMQATRDVLSCLNTISVFYTRSVLDYAVWYRETQKEEATYQQFITKLTCHLVVHTSFLTPNIAWKIVLFA